MSAQQPPTKKQKFAQYKSKSYSRYSKKQYLETGQRGFLATCNFREKDCVRECYNVLNQYADELYGVPQETIVLLPLNEETGGDDIADTLQKEIYSAAETPTGKDRSKQRFQVVDTGTTNCVFIRTTLPDPVELGSCIVKDIARTREQKTRFLLRLVPVEVVCHANLADISKAGGFIFDKHFLKEPSTFSIVFNKRYNNDIKRDDVIRELAALVQAKNICNRVDLKQAAKTVVVEVIKGLCCLAVIEGYLQHKKYNLVELANPKVAEPKRVETKAKAQKVVEEKGGGAKQPEEKQNEGDVAVEKTGEVEENKVLI